MSRVRFATAKDLFETFPELFKTIRLRRPRKPSIDFLKGLSAQGRLEDAVTFCAYLLPRREAVWWACARCESFGHDARQEQGRGTDRRRSVGATA